MMKLEQLQLEMPEEEFIQHGHAACPGCPASLLLRHVLKVLGPRTIIAGLPGCTQAVVCNRVAVPWTRCVFAAGAAVASGVRAALDMQGDINTHVIVWSGDGGTFDIGVQALSAAAERGEDFIWFLFDNEAYMNTGIQRSSATPMGAWTTTTPVGSPKEEPKKNMMEIMAAHRIPYAATATIAYPQDMVRKIRKAISSDRGVKFIHFLGPCPTGWRFPPDWTVKVSRLAVQSKVFPLYEIENGLQYIVQRPEREVPVRDYLELQGRFSHLTQDEIEAIQENVDWEWQHLLTKVQAVTEPDKAKQPAV